MFIGVIFYPISVRHGRVCPAHSERLHISIDSHGFSLILISGWLSDGEETT
jgi:hypothetical protein